MRWPVCTCLSDWRFLIEELLIVALSLCLAIKMTVVVGAGLFCYAHNQRSRLSLIVLIALALLGRFLAHEQTTGDSSRVV